jgi:hypothetical protein
VGVAATAAQCSWLKLTIFKCLFTRLIMSLDDTDDYIDEYGMFLEAPFVLTKEEYSRR